MKKINDSINRLSSEEINSLAKALKLKKYDGENSLISRILSFYGLYLILSDLSSDELSILGILHGDEEGLTFGEIEKILGIPTGRIEEISNNLSAKLLIYVFKNRQRINNKLDKIYIFPEILAFIETQNDNRISQHLEALLKGSRDESSLDVDYLQALKDDKNSLRLINALYDSGGLINIYEALKTISDKSLNEILAKLIELKIIEIHFDFHFPFSILILLNKKVFFSIKKQREAKVTEKNNIRNYYNFILNLINTYDTVSSYGLFLTKQKNFRKIDKKRAVESMNRIFDSDGTELDCEITLQLSFYILFILKSLKIKHDAVIISLNNIEKYIDSPIKILEKVLKNLSNNTDNPLFHSPFPIPSVNSLKEIIVLTSEYSEESISSMSIIFLLRVLLKCDRKQLKDLAQIREKILIDFNNCIRFLCITGIINIHNGVLQLSDIGYEIGLNFSKDKISKKEPKEYNRNIYINPDFTLIIPQREIPSEALYHILTHTDIIKDDIILHARISKNSIIRAYKRGMSHDKFLSTLKRYSKNEIPQNLHFLITEWSANIIQVKISNPTILYTNYPSLIDEISFSEIKSSIIERISENYAIIDRNFLSDIIKIANKKDAVIRIFEDIDEG